MLGAKLGQCSDGSKSSLLQEKKAEFDKNMKKFKSLGARATATDNPGLMPTLITLADFGWKWPPDNTGDNGLQGNNDDDS